MVSEVISLSPWLSSSRTILETSSSIRSGSTGRLRNAICTDRRSLSRSNGTRRPLRLMTVSSRSCTRSNVVKRKLQARQTRRRRMTELSSVGRESLTWVSRLPQIGQRIGFSNQTIDDGGQRTDRDTAAFLFHGPSSVVCRPLSVDRKPRDQLLDLLAHGSFDRRIGIDALVGEGIEHLDNQFPNLLEFADPEAARRPRGCAQAHARGYHR